VAMALFIITFGVGLFKVFLGEIFYVMVVIGIFIITLAFVILLCVASQFFYIPMKSKPKLHKVVLTHPEESYLTLVPDQYKDYSDELLKRELKERKGSTLDIVA